MSRIPQIPRPAAAIDPATTSDAARLWPLPTLAVILVLGSGLRIALGAAFGLSVDETYTTAIARQFSLSYFDHPPLHVWLVGGWARLVGSEAPWIVRLPFIAVFVATSVLLHRLTRDLFGQRAALWAVLAISLSPIFTVGVGSWVLPDGPLACLALVMVSAAREAIDRQEAGRSALPAWGLAGVAAGGALLAKYLAIFPIAGVGLYLVTTPHRRVLVTPGPWLAATLAALVFSPVIAWNAGHHWASFVFQGSRAGYSSISLGRMVATALGQVAYLSPALAAALVASLWRAARRGRDCDATWLIVCVAVPPIAFFTVAALWTTILPHWPAIGWLFVFVPLGADLAALEARCAPGLVRGLRASIAYLAFVVALVVSQTTTGWLDRWIPSFPQSDPAVDMLDWSALRDELKARGALGPTTLVGTLSFVDAGKVDYALGGTVPVLCLSRAPHHYPLLHDVDAYAGRDVLIVSNGRRRDWLELAAPYFEAVVPQADVVLARAGEGVLTLHVAIGRALRPPAQPY